MRAEVGMSSSKRLRKLLLLEPDYMLRHTVALTARSAGLAVVKEAPSIDTAHALLQSDRFDGALVAFNDGDDQAMWLIEYMRSGRSLSSADMPIGVMVGKCNAETATRLQSIGINQIILRPFKVKTLLNTIQVLSTS